MTYPSFILMIRQLPILDGNSAIRGLWRVGYKMPIIALTAMVLKDNEARIIECGCSTHLTKPIDFKQLVETIAQFTDV